MSTLHRSWQYSQYHSLLLLFTSCILQIVLVFWILDDCVTGGRCLWSLLPLNGWVGLNQLSVNRFCWEVNRVLCDWSRVVRRSAATRSTLHHPHPPLVTSTWPTFLTQSHITAARQYNIFISFSCCGQS